MLRNCYRQQLSSTLIPALNKLIDVRNRKKLSKTNTNYDVVVWLSLFLVVAGYDLRKNERMLLWLPAYWSSCRLIAYDSFCNIARCWLLHCLIVEEWNGRKNSIALVAMKYPSLSQYTKIKRDFSIIMIVWFEGVNIFEWKSVLRMTKNILCQTTMIDIMYNFDVYQLIMVSVSGRYRQHTIIIFVRIARTDAKN